MRNRKFRFSDMIPNAWFHKLQEIGRGRSQFNQTPSNSKKELRQPPLPSPQSKQKQPQIPSPPPPSCSRKSYYFTRDLQSNDGFCINSPPPPKKSPKQQKSRPSTRSSSRDLFDRDIVIDMSSKYTDNVVASNFDSHSELDLRPIITKKKEKHAKQRTTAAAASQSKKTPASSPGGVRLRSHSPRIGHRKSTSSRRSFSGSTAVMKSSHDPQRDFRESMVEMIVENNMRSSKDLEDLLACYLSLNAHEYHDVIIQVFKQIWFHLSEPAL